MTQPLQNDLTTWCKANVSLDTADRLDRGGSPVPLYLTTGAQVADVLLAAPMNCKKT